MDDIIKSRFFFKTSKQFSSSARHCTYICTVTGYNTIHMRHSRQLLYVCSVRVERGAIFIFPSVTSESSVEVELGGLLLYCFCQDGKLIPATGSSTDMERLSDGFTSSETREKETVSLSISLSRSVRRGLSISHFFLLFRDVQGTADNGDWNNQRV